MARLGLGPTWRAGATTIDLDAMCWHVASEGHLDSGLSLLNQLRLSVALDVGPIALVASACGFDDSARGHAHVRREDRGGIAARTHLAFRFGLS